jgi:hypothetical protein
MSKKYLIEGSALAGPVTPPQSLGSPASPSLSPQLIAKVNDWVNTQPVPFSSESARKSGYEMKDVIQEPSPEMSPERKKVHWTPNVQDNEGKTIRKPQPRQGRQGDKTIVLSSKTHRQPSVPDPPRSRGPPPAPRPRRLPTPDLPDLKCGDFCDCCYTEPMTKMNAQRKISAPYWRLRILTREVAAAASHIANARRPTRRLT